MFERENLKASFFVDNVDQTRSVHIGLLEERLAKMKLSREYLSRTEPGDVLKMALHEADADINSLELQIKHAREARRRANEID